MMHGCRLGCRLGSRFRRICLLCAKRRGKRECREARKYGSEALHVTSFENRLLDGDCTPIVARSAAGRVLLSGKTKSSSVLFFRRKGGSDHAASSGATRFLPLIGTQLGAPERDR